MSTRHNSLGQEIGSSLPTWNTCPKPANKTMVGAYCRLEALDATRHGEDLWQAYSADTEDRIWTYLPYGPFTTQTELKQWLTDHSAIQDPLFYAIISTSSGKAVGIATYLRIQPAAGVIEVGHINYSPALQATTAATEAMYLMMKNAFDLGYRRYEWKCDNLNLHSKKALTAYLSKLRSTKAVIETPRGFLYLIHIGLPYRQNMSAGWPPTTSLLMEYS
jgi:RimJ/RimL family protein N-acetyltransferase